MNRTAPHSPTFLPAISLCQRELVRFLRQRHRIIGALATPILFWVVLGAGIGRSFRSSQPGSANFMQYFFPGTLVMILLFTAIFSTISIIEDRKEGFLQSVLVAPVSPMAIVLGKILGGTLLATGQGLLFLALSPFIGVHFSVLSFLATVGMMLLVSFGLTGLGFCIAWRMSSTQGFHAIMNLFLMPLWFLSGSLFPAAGSAAPMRWAMRLNPLSYGVSGLRRALYLTNPTPMALPGWSVCLGISIIASLVMFWLSATIARGRVAADWQ